MIHQLKKHFKMYTHLEVATTELATAELELLEALSAREYADSVVSYNTARITRLRKFITTAAKAETPPKSPVQLVATP